MHSEPLIDVAMSYITESMNKISEDIVQQERSILRDYIHKRITYQEAKGELLKITNTTQPLDKVKSILDIEDEPVPPSPVIDETTKNSRKKTRTWTNTEDLRLLKGIYIHGLDKWNEVSQYVGNGRTRSQCSQRWIRVLDPRISKSNWTKEEEAKLVELVMLYGEKSWAKVSTMMGNRSDVQCRYRYQQLPKSKIIQHQKDIDGEKAVLKQQKKKIVQKIVKPQSFIKQEIKMNTTSEPNLLEERKAPIQESIPQEKEQTTNESNDNISLFNDNMKLDERIPLGSSFFDVFKSDQLFDSSFWA